MVQGVSALHSLRVLILSAPRSEQFDVSPLARLSRLESLTLVGGAFGGLDAMLSSCCMLRELRLPNLALLSPTAQSPSLGVLIVNTYNLNDDKLLLLDLPRMFPRLLGLRVLGLGIAPKMHGDRIDVQRLSLNARWLARSRRVSIDLGNRSNLNWLIPTLSGLVGEDTVALASSALSPLVGWGPALATRGLQVVGASFSPAMCQLLARVFPRVMVIHFHAGVAFSVGGKCLLRAATQFRQLQHLQMFFSSFDSVDWGSLAFDVVAACTHAQSSRPASNEPFTIVMFYNRGNAWVESRCRACKEAWEAVGDAMPGGLRSRVLVKPI